MVENRVLPNGVVSVDIFYLTILMNFKATRRFSPFSQPLHRREGGREEKSRKKKKKNLSAKYKSHLPMASHPLSLSFLLLSFLISSVSSSSQPIIQLPTTTDRKSNVDDDLYCASWHLSVETNNAGSWKQIPIRCESFVQDYMTGPRYMSDSEIVANYSLAYASSVEIGRDGKDAWVFDIDETLLTNLPYYQAHGFGYLMLPYELTLILIYFGHWNPVRDSPCKILLLLIRKAPRLPQLGVEASNLLLLSCYGRRSEPFDENSWDVWVDLAEAPAIPASLKLYNELKQMGFKIFVLTGRSENQRNATGKNLLFAGYTDWERLILRGPSDDGTLATVYKSEKRSDLVNEGYRIHGSSGDQWSDLLGFAVAKRSFKLPNPIYVDLGESWVGSHKSKQALLMPGLTGFELENNIGDWSS
ncbi:hypothetical protein SCA6_011740 [Theobroma cacao]